MKVFENIEPLKVYLSSLEKGTSIGFVPTMGSLHKGHLELIKKSKQTNQITVCSIFINKIQFNIEEDYIKYPRNNELDTSLLTEENCDCLFIPSPETVFPNNYVYKKYELGTIESILEGTHRPGHFQGVCNVVERLIDIINPTKLYLGLKDLQQCKVIEKMLSLNQLEDVIKIEFCETIRNQNGLALSSRNERLSEKGLVNAQALSKTLQYAKEQILMNDEPTHISLLEQKCINMITEKGFESVDYFSFVDYLFHPIEQKSNPKKPAYILTAAIIEGVRLIDNIIL